MRPNTPVIFGIEQDEGELFVNLIFHTIQFDLQVRPSTYRRFVEKIADGHGIESDDIVEMYPPPCDNNRNPDCDCAQILKDLLTDDTWICDFRRAMTSNVRPNNPFYPLFYTSTLSSAYKRTWIGLLRQCVDTEASCHCSGN